MNIRSRRRRKRATRKTCSKKLIKRYINQSPFLNKGEKIIIDTEIEKWENILKKMKELYPQKQYEKEIMGVWGVQEPKQCHKIKDWAN